MLNIILFGAPGAGKGTQAAKIVALHGFAHFSTGEILRRAILDETPLGLEAKEYISRGELVPDEMVVGIIDQAIEANQDARGLIFDGFPRTVAQAEQLDALLAKRGQQVDALILLEVAEEELLKRLLIRAEKEDRPDDRDESVVRNRISIYERQSAPVAEYYDKQHRLHRVNGVGDIDTLHRRVLAVVESLM